MNNNTDISNMPAITKKLDALLKGEDFSRLEAGRNIDDNNKAINRLLYMNDRERISIYIFEL